LRAKVVGDRARIVEMGWINVRSKLGLLEGMLDGKLDGLL